MQRALEPGVGRENAWPADIRFGKRGFARVLAAAALSCVAWLSAPSVSEAARTTEPCSSPMNGVWGVRIMPNSNLVNCAVARKVILSRERRGHPPTGWNCYYPKRVRGKSYWSRACKLGAASGGAILRYYVRNPAPYDPSE